MAASSSSLLFSCLELFNEPKLLSCLHTFCKDCLNKLKDTNGRSHLISCPSCRKTVQLPDGEAAQLQDNFFVTHLLSMMSVYSKCKDGNASCSDCDSGDPPVSWCSECAAFLCGFCTQSHQRKRATTDHEISTLEQLKAQTPLSVRVTKPAMCKEHANKTLEMYCCDCELCICLVCAITKHKEHNLKTVDEAFVEQKVSIGKLLLKGEDVVGKCADALKKVNERQSEIENHVEKQHGIIDQCFDEFFQIVEERRKHMHEEVETLKLSKVKVLELQAESLEMSLASTKSAVEFGHEALNKGSAADVLTIKKQIIDRIKELRVGSYSYKPEESHLLKCEDLRQMLRDAMTVCRSLSCDTLKQNHEYQLSDVGAMKSSLERSDIIGNKREFVSQLSTWLKDSITSKSTSIWKRCYWAKQDGFEAEAFHSRCDDLGPTVTIIQSEEGYIFGGFTPLSWKNSGGWLHDTSMKSFLFSLYNHEKMAPVKLQIKRSQHSIFCKNGCGPVFGGGSDLSISHSSNNNKCSYSRLGRTYATPSGMASQSIEAQSFLAGSLLFKVSDIEVFQCVYS